MKNFKELIKRKKFITLILSLFITISGLFIFVLSLSMLAIPSLAGFTIISSIILMFIGYMIPKAIIKLENDKENKQQQDHNEIKDVIKNLRDIKLANDNEKQNYILAKKIKKTMSLPISLTFFLIIWFSIIFIIVGFIKYNEAPFLVLVGFVLLAVDIIIFNIHKIKNRNHIQKIMNNKIYVADCYAYDRKTEKYKEYYGSGNDTRSRRGIYTLYFIKITDGNYFVNKWFPISAEQYNKAKIDVKLYVSDELDIYDIIPNNNSN